MLLTALIKQFLDRAKHCDELFLIDLIYTHTLCINLKINFSSSKLEALSVHKCVFKYNMWYACVWFSIFHLLNTTKRKTN